MKKEYNFWVYIVTNAERTVLYTGMTNDLTGRLKEHYDNRGKYKTFAGRYWRYNLVYYEWYQYVLNAIAREKEIKNWLRVKKIALIEERNPEWKFFNAEICGHWPPKFEGR
ncbi:MAG: GIY-YIG nuclease family protein [Saprospiraceae bacterium]|nr:GIY-YIG nuclease family protein [Saprospiraceae bacterium]